MPSHNSSKSSDNPDNNGSQHSTSSSSGEELDVNIDPQTQCVNAVRHARAPVVGANIETYKVVGSYTLPL